MKAFFFDNREDIALIRTPLLIAVATLIVCAGSYTGGVLFRDTQRQALQAAAADRQQAGTLYRNVVQEEKTTRAYIDHYRQLSTQGIIGDEDRLALIERLGQLREAHRLYPVEVEIAPQAAVADIPFGQSGTGLALRATAIQLHLNLLHEGDLVRLLAGLGEVRGLLVTEACSIEMSHRPVDGAPADLTENLSASCRLFWVTLKAQGF